MKTSVKKMVLVFSVIFITAFASPICLFATNLDDISSGETQDGQSDSSTSQFNSNTSITDYMRDYEPVTEENMQKANAFAGPLASAIGTLTGMVMIVVTAGIFLVTAIDLAYIGIPALRPTLNPNMGMQGGAPMGGMGMGGMGGYGGYGMRGGMGMGMGAGGAQPTGKRCLVSDEAIQAVNMAQASTQPQGGGMGGMGMGGMGMMGGGMGMQQQQQPQGTESSPITTYLKKRLFFVIIFVICSVVLLSSVLMDCGINLAQLVLKIINKFNGSISNVNI